MFLFKFEDRHCIFFVLTENVDGSPFFLPTMIFNDKNKFKNYKKSQS